MIAFIFVDGLEYEIVAKHALFGRIRQKYYGKYPVNPRLKTTEYWAQILTGKEYRSVPWYRPGPLFKVAKLVPRPIRRRLKRFRSSFRKRALRPVRLEGTIIDKLKDEGYKVYAVNVFDYNEDEEAFRHRLEYPILRLLDMSIEERRGALAELVRIERGLFERFLHALKSGEYDACFVYVRFIDVAGHVLPKELLKYYVILLRWISELPRGVPYLILSDHGTVDGLHTPYGFYSFGHPLPREPKGSADWYYIIEDLAKAYC